MNWTKRLLALVGPSCVVLAVATAIQLQPGKVTADQTTHAHDSDVGHSHGEASEAAAATPDSRDPNRLWCGEHGVYEDECLLCHPELAKGAKPEEGGGLMCNEHRLLEAECGICHPELAVELRPGQGVKVRLPSAASLAKAGIDTGRPSPSGGAESLAVTARVTYNQNHLAQVSARASGVVAEVKANAGDYVEKGDVLAVIESPEVAEARSAYRAAAAALTLSQATHQREKRLVERGISAKRDLHEAEAALATASAQVSAARERLLSLGLSEADIRGNGLRLAVRAPFAATVTERHAVVGEAVDFTRPLFVVADLSELWLELAIPEDRVASIGVSDRVTARFTTLPGLTFDAEVSWIDSKVDEQSRTVKARAIVPNPSGLLKHGMFGEVQLANAATPGVFELPAEAVQQVEGRAVVFVRLEDDLYELRGITLGRRRGPYVEVREGVKIEDEIVLARSYTLKSELLKSRLGAGCADH